MERITFEDADGQRLDVCFEKLSPTSWRTFVLHSKERGATSYHTSVRSARQAWMALEQSVLQRGWVYKKVIHLDKSAPAPMREAPGGGRMFRDRRTGKYFEDLSASAPPRVATPEDPRVRRPKPPPLTTLLVTTPPKVPAHVDAFTEFNLPKPRS